MGAKKGIFNNRNFKTKRMFLHFLAVFRFCSVFLAELFAIDVCFIFLPFYDVEPFKKTSWIISIFLSHEYKWEVVQKAEWSKSRKTEKY